MNKYRPSFTISFTDAQWCNKYATKRLLKIPPHFKRVVTLLREILMSAFEL